MTRGLGGQSPANVQNFLRGVRYPATKDDLIAAATKNGAPPEVMKIINALGADRFGGPQEVMKSYSAENRSNHST